MRNSKKKFKAKAGDLISLRSCVPESDKTQIESEMSDQVSMWVRNGTVAVVLGIKENRVTIMCNSFTGWVWTDECLEVES